MTSITVILRSIRYKFITRSESKVLTCDSNAFYSKVLKINELLLREFDVKVKLYESINLKWKLRIYFVVQYSTI